MAIVKIAHRGYSERFPENTMASFSAAVEAGADMIELDVHLSADNRLVVIHDDEIDRTSNGKGLVKTMTLSELRQFDYCYRFKGTGRHEIPLLDEVLEQFSTQVGVNIEIKNIPQHYQGIEQHLSVLLKKKDFIEKTVVSSFDHEALATLKGILPGVRTGLLYDKKYAAFRFDLRRLGCWSIHPDISAMDEDDILFARSLGVKVFPWVAKKKSQLDRIIASGLADGIMVNDLSLFSDKKNENENQSK